MAGWPGSYFQVIYPMGASAGTGTAPETPPFTLGGAPGGVAAMPAGATGWCLALQWDQYRHQQRDREMAQYLALPWGQYLQQQWDQQVAQYMALP